MEKYERLRDELLSQMREIYYWHVHRSAGGKNEPKWRGVRMVKFPTDLCLYAEVILENKPDYIIEAGTRFGGSSLFFADMLKIIDSPGKVLSIDPVPAWTQTHPFLEYIEGSSVDKELVGKIRERIKGSKVMVVLDSDHRRRHVIQELRRWNGAVTKGQYLVVEDCYTKYADRPYLPKAAVDWFLGRTKDFVQVPLENKYLMAVTRYGWLRKVR